MLTTLLSELLVQLSLPPLSSVVSLTDGLFVCLLLFLSVNLLMYLFIGHLSIMYLDTTEPSMSLVPGNGEIIEVDHLIRSRTSKHVSLIIELVL